MRRFSSLWTALVTPFTSANELDLETLQQLIQRQIGKVEGLLLLGSTGEPSTLSLSEREEVLHCAQGKIPFLVGATASTPHDALLFVRQAEEAEAAGLLLAPPPYIRPCQEGLIKFFSTVADHTHLPLLLYENPSRTGVSIAPETVTVLAKHPKIVGIKVANERIDYFARMPRGDFSLLAGDDALFLPMASLGAVGLISVISNAYPAETKRMVDTAECNDFARARAHYYEKLAPLLEQLSYASNPIPIKQLCAKQGLLQPHVRPPLVLT